MFNPWIILGIAIAFAGAMYGSYSKGGRDATNRINAEYLAKSVKAEQDARKEEQRRALAQKEADDKYALDVKTAQADAASANDALGKLRKRLANFNNGPINIGTSAVCPSTDALSDVFSRCAGRYTKLGEDADAARNAGLQCQNYYDSNISNKVKAQLGKTP